MREMLGPVVEELKRLKQEGETGVYLADETWDRLQKLAKAQSSHSAERAKHAVSGGKTQASRLVESHKTSGSESSAPKPEAKLAAASPKTEPQWTIAPIPPPPVVKLPDGDRKAQWEWLRKRVLECTTCNARLRPGKQVVFGTGNLEADIFFCGEAPGAEEENKGEPFVGPAGQLLTKIIQAMGVQREQVYISNIMNWRPEMPTEFGNRKPTPEEMAFCLPYLQAQLAVVQPKVIVALGMTAANGLLGPDPKRRLADVRGTWHSFGEIPMMITYHPSYLLRNNTLRTKRVVWEDMLLVMEKVGLPISARQRSYFAS